ncbi:MAG: HU family DNA-binding protein [Firmicutes bacterium]|jgi:DNA-binding protein HU-beta|nr:HU family DNA-binding protein [Bacillota bacterium]HQD39907.1 HU family DNA-binding protein [Bacillota bacterium]
MTKSELIDSIAQISGFTKKDAGKALDAVIEAIKQSLMRGEKVQVVGFGTFEVRERAERIGRNPRTKAEVVIPARKVPVFKAGKALKDVVK